MFPHMLRAWWFHNLFAHPMSEILYWAGAVWRPCRAASAWLHDATVPPLPHDEHARG